MFLLHFKPMALDSPATAASPSQLARRPLRGARTARTTKLTPEKQTQRLLNEGPIKFGYRIAILRNWYGGPGYKRMERDYGLSEPETSVLFCLGHSDGLRAQDISNITGRPKNSISRAVNLLLRKGQIRRVPDPNDKRQKSLYLTRSGAASYKIIVPIFRDREKAMLKPLTREELVLLDGMLKKMVASLPRWTAPY